MERVLPFLILASIASGCTQLEDARLEGRLRRMARSAYANSPGACNGVAHSYDYVRGFEEGYYDVASGGDGCPPALPPKKYWSATYASPVGQEHIEAWFQGFRDGAATAKSDGVASFGVLHISAEHRVARQSPGVVAPPLPPPPKVVESLSTVESSRPPQNAALPPPTSITLPQVEPSTDAPQHSKTLTAPLAPPPTPVSSTSREKPNACDSSGWRQASSKPSPDVVKAEFKQPATSSKSQTHPAIIPSAEAGWRPAASKSVRLQRPMDDSFER